MLRVPKETEAAERELRGEPRPELRDRPTSASGEQPLDSGGARRANQATSSPPEGSQQGPQNGRIIPPEGGSSNGNPIRSPLHVEAGNLRQQGVPSGAVRRGLPAQGEQALVELGKPPPKQGKNLGPEPGAFVPELGVGGILPPGPPEPPEVVGELFVAEGKE